MVRLLLKSCTEKEKYVIMAIIKIFQKKRRYPI